MKRNLVKILASLVLVVCIFILSTVAVFAETEVNSETGGTSEQVVDKEAMDAAVWKKLAEGKKAEEDAKIAEVAEAGYPYVAEAKDISTWALDAVKVLRDSGIVDNKFLGRFQEKITRAEFAKLASSTYKVAVEDEIEPKENKFEDIKDSIYMQDINDAFSLGIVNGTSPKTFNPDGFITRQEICAMLVRLIKAVEPDTITEVKEDIKFTDLKQISAWALNDVKYAFENNIMNGVAKDTIAPLSNATREQALTLVYRLATTNKYIKAYTKEDLLQIKLHKNEMREGVQEYLDSVPEVPRKYYEKLLADLDYDMARPAEGVDTGILIFLDDVGIVTLDLGTSGDCAYFSYSAVYSRYSQYKDIFHGKIMKQNNGNIVSHALDKS